MNVFIRPEFLYERRFKYCSSSINILCNYKMVNVLLSKGAKLQREYRAVHFTRNDILLNDIVDDSGPRDLDKFPK